MPVTEPAVQFGQPAVPGALRRVRDGEAVDPTVRQRGYPNRSPRPHDSTLSPIGTGRVTIRHALYPTYRGAGAFGHTDRRTTLWMPSAPTTRSAVDSPAECSTVPSGRTARTTTPVRNDRAGTAASRMLSRSARCSTATGPYRRSSSAVSVRASQRPAPWPKSDLALLYGLGRMLVQLKRADHDFVATHTEGVRTSTAAHVRGLHPRAGGGRDRGVPVAQLEHLAATIDTAAGGCRSGGRWG